MPRERNSFALRSSKVTCVVIEGCRRQGACGRRIGLIVPHGHGEKTRTGTTSTYLFRMHHSRQEQHPIEVLVNVDAGHRLRLVLLVVGTVGNPKTEYTLINYTTCGQREEATPVFNLQFFYYARHVRRQRYQLLVPDQVRSDTVGAIIVALARAQPHAAPQSNEGTQQASDAENEGAPCEPAHTRGFRVLHDLEIFCVHMLYPVFWQTCGKGQQRGVEATERGRCYYDMTRPEACEGKSVRKDKDATCRVVAKRLAWLAKDSNWDGTLRPLPKLLPPPSSGNCIHKGSIRGLKRNGW